MKKISQPKEKDAKEVTLSDFFKVVDMVAKKAINDESSKKIIDSAAQKWESDSRYAF